MLRGDLALLFLGALLVGYLYDVVQGAVNGTGVSPGTHQYFWGTIGISALLTAASIQHRTKK